jgi:hypothetical protein
MPNAEVTRRATGRDGRSQPIAGRWFHRRGPRSHYCFFCSRTGAGLARHAFERQTGYERADVIGFTALQLGMWVDRTEWESVEAELQKTELE